MTIAAFDASDEAAVNSTLPGMPFDVLVNCVAWVRRGAINSTSHEQRQRSFRVDVDPVSHATFRKPAVYPRPGRTLHFVIDDSGERLQRTVALPLMEMANA